jgi:hypothetical protein
MTITILAMAINNFPHLVLRKEICINGASKG